MKQKKHNDTGSVPETEGISPSEPASGTDPVPPSPAAGGGHASKAETGGKPQTIEEKAAEHYDQLIRLKAEFENYRKRVEKEKPELVRWGKAGILLKLIPLYDVLLNAHAHVNDVMDRDRSAADERGPGSGKTEDLFKGLEIILKEFSKVFKSEGILVMETVGKSYDPMSHEVVGTVDGDSSSDGTVVEELQRGFTVEGKVLRPARVKIVRKKETLSDTKSTKESPCEKGDLGG